MSAMLRLKVVGLGIAFIGAAACAHAPPTSIQIDGHEMKLDDVVKGVVDDYRQMLVLADENDSSAEGRDALVIARILYQGNHDRLDLVGEGIGGDTAAADALVDRVMKPELRDGDRMAFYDTVMELPATPKVQAAQQRLNRIQQEYAEKLRQLMEKLTPGTRGSQPVPEAWEDYIAFIKQSYSRPDLLAKYAMYREEGGGGTRGPAMWRESAQQIVGLRLPPKTVVLTFDDGPHRKYTESVLKILDRYHIKAVFFEVGHNVERLPDRSKAILRAGHALGNHSLTHAYLPRLDGPGLDKEIETTSEAIKKATASAPVLFRAPYGAETQQILDLSTRLGMKAVLWNIDSLDWKDPLPESIVERVLREVDRKRHGIILFHDIHRRTLTVLPMVIDRLIAEGYTFYAWNGSDFAPQPAKVVHRN
jgi:peptidoglycan/xylan/chitin deacetylase (PgdA/CDA1 family)